MNAKPRNGSSPYLTMAAGDRSPRSITYVLITARLTNENAASAPKLIIEDTVVRLMTRAVSPIAPTRTLPTTGVRKRGCSQPNTGRGRLPSRPMA